MKPVINPGATIGYGVVTESDINLDAFGNIQSGSKPIIWEGPLMSQMQAKERARKNDGYGRRLVVKLVVVEEVR